MKTQYLYRHKCSVSGVGMEEGWYIDGEYFATSDLADNQAKINGFKNFSEMYVYYNQSIDDEEPINTDFCYWTTWYQDDFDLEEEGEAYDKEGNKYKFNKETKNWIKTN